VAFQGLSIRLVPDESTSESTAGVRFGGGRQLYSGRQAATRLRESRRRGARVLILPSRFRHGEGAPGDVPGGQEGGRRGCRGRRLAGGRPVPRRAAAAARH
jgi:hypothetical protein